MLRVPSETLAALMRGLEAVIDRTAALALESTTASAARITATTMVTDRRFTSAGRGPGRLRNGAGTGRTFTRNPCDNNHLTAAENCVTALGPQ